MPKRERFGKWPFVSAECRRDMDALLKAGGPLSAYRANKAWPIGPVEGSWAWKAERLAEEQFAMAHVAFCSSGTTALMAAIFALDMPPGEIIVSPYTFSASAAAIKLMGHEPVFADIDPTTFCLDPVSVATVVDTRRTRAIMPVDLFGQMADYEALWRFGLPIVEDACQAVGAQRKNQSYRDEPLWGGRGGSIGVWSLNGGKNAPAGEAGAVVTNSESLAKRARLWLNHAENFGESWVGINGRINEPTALLAYHGLKEVQRRNTIRQNLAGVLVHKLRNDDRVAVLPEPDYHALYVFPLVLAARINRATFANILKRQGIEVGEGYLTPPIYKYKAFEKCRRTDMPVVDELSEKTLVLLTQVRPPATVSDIKWLGDWIIKALGEAAQ